MWGGGKGGGRPACRTHLVPHLHSLPSPFLSPGLRPHLSTLPTHPNLGVPLPTLMDQAAARTRTYDPCVTPSTPPLHLPTHPYPRPSFVRLCDATRCCGFSPPAGARLSRLACIHFCSDQVRFLHQSTCKTIRNNRCRPLPPGHPPAPAPTPHPRLPTQLYFYVGNVRNPVPHIQYVIDYVKSHWPYYDRNGAPDPHPQTHVHTHPPHIHTPPPFLF